MKVAAIAPFGLRIPPELREKLDSEAKKHSRTLTSEILYRLEQSFSDPDISPGDMKDVLTHLEELRQRIDDLTEQSKTKRAS